MVAYTKPEHRDIQNMLIKMLGGTVRHLFTNLRARRRKLVPERIHESRHNEEIFFYLKEIFAILDRIMTDCRENRSRITVKIKPFTLLLPPWGSVSEELAKELDHLSIGKASSGSPVTEPGALREDFLGKKLVKTCLSAELQIF